MALNYIWIGFFIVAFVVGVARLAFTGDTSVFPQMQESLIKMAEKGFETSIAVPSTGSPDAEWPQTYPVHGPS